ncbi:response regulator [Niastella sp. OAS944]|uniref:response regulator n=1 Tax=Niastella sp. OAS944 TaxID=2664089 RepID=UPI00347D6467|nr:DNA-binding NarL/FixJ family response regulator [Chitinophagaceae bacterium OAS944]
MKITVAIVDDHKMHIDAVKRLITESGKIEVVAAALNGEGFLQQLSLLPQPPDIALIDVEMKTMNGITVATTIQERYPTVKMAALSQREDDYTIIKMIRAGCCAYLIKNSMDFDQLENAILEINAQGYYNADAININHRRLLTKTMRDEDLKITDREREFLQLACSDLAYKQVADKMNLSERTIDGYRENLFSKLNVHTRVGMVLEGLRRGVISI